MRVAVLGASGSWHSRGLIGTLATRRHEVLAIPATRLRSSVGEGKDAHVLGPATSWSSRCSARWATRSCASRIETWPIGCFVPLELEPIVYYVQRTVVPAGRLRDPVVAGEVAGAMERVTHSSRANVACHARPHAVTPNDDERDLTLAAAAPIEADVAGMDLLIASDGEAVVLDVTGIPGWQALQSACEQDPTELVMST
jgi:hypothetical protein